MGPRKRPREMLRMKTSPEKKWGAAFEGPVADAVREFYEWERMPDGERSPIQNESLKAALILAALRAVQKKHDYTDKQLLPYGFDLEALKAGKLRAAIIGRENGALASNRR